MSDLEGDPAVVDAGTSDTDTDTVDVTASESDGTKTETETETSASDEVSDVDESKSDQDANDDVSDEEPIAPVDDGRPGVPAVSAPIGIALDDPALEPSIDLARRALGEITSIELVGDLDAVVDEGDGVYSLRFATTQPGYPDWFWTVSMVRLEDEAVPNVLETELLPGDDALLAPPWLPWADRLAEYQASHASADASTGDEAEESTPDGGELAATMPVTSRRHRRRTRVRAGAVEQTGDEVEGASDDADPTTATDASAESDDRTVAAEPESDDGDEPRPARGAVLRTRSRRRRAVRVRAGSTDADTDSADGEADGVTPEQA